MARILRLSSLQRNVLTCIALFITTNVIVVSQYWGPRKVALSLDDEGGILDPHLRSTSTANASRVLLVSGLFALSSSATLNATYLERLPLFLGPITTDIYFYTSSNLASTVRAARGAGLPLTIDTSFTSPFDIPPLKGRQLVYDRMHTVPNTNGSSAVYTPELYAFWNAKPFFLEHAVKSLRGVQEYDYVFWVDAGSFTDEHLYSSWPDRERLDKIWEDGSRLSGGKRKDDLIFFPINNPPPKNTMYWTEDMGPLDADFSEGSFFGGSPASVLWLSRKFYSYHDYFIQLGYFSGKERTTINSILLLYPSRFITVWVYDPEAVARGGLPPDFLNRGYLGSCGSETHYYQWWMSDRETREGMRNWWMGHDSKQRQHAQTTWWKLRVPCRFTGVLGVEGVLKRTFGEMWQAPVGTIVRPSRTW